MPADTNGNGAEKVNENGATAPDEVELVRHYVREHFGPIEAALREAIPDAATRLVALDKTTRHIFHWVEDRKMRAAEAAAGVIEARQERASNGHGANGGDVPDYYPGFVRGDQLLEGQGGGDVPATPKQLAYLKDRGVPVPTGLTKAEASRLIKERIERQVRR